MAVVLREIVFPSCGRSIVLSVSASESTIFRIYLEMACRDTCQRASDKSTISLQQRSLWLLQTMSMVQSSAMF